MDLLLLIGDQLYSQLLYNKKITHMKRGDQIFGTSFYSYLKTDTLPCILYYKGLKIIACFTTLPDEGTQYKDYRVHLIVFDCDTCISGDQPDVESPPTQGRFFGIRHRLR